MAEIIKAFLGQKQCHSLKTWPDFFCHILTGDKRFEIRKDDRKFIAGDYIWLREWCPTAQGYTLRSVVMKVGCVLVGEHFPGLSADYAAFTIIPVDSEISDQVKAVLSEALA